MNLTIDQYCNADQLSFQMAELSLMGTMEEIRAFERALFSFPKENESLILDRLQQLADAAKAKTNGKMVVSNEAWMTRVGNLFDGGQRAKDARIERVHTAKLRNGGLLIAVKLADKVIIKGGNRRDLALTIG